jgi:hypothetical protein
LRSSLALGWAWRGPFIGGYSLGPLWLVAALWPCTAIRVRLFLSQVAVVGCHNLCRSRGIKESLIALSSLQFTTHPHHPTQTISYIHVQNRFPHCTHWNACACPAFCPEEDHFCGPYYSSHCASTPGDYGTSLPTLRTGGVYSCVLPRSQLLN